MPTQAQATTVADILGRLEGVLDHRFKKDGITLVETSVQGGYIASWADELAILMETLADIAATNDPRQCEGDPLDRERADYKIQIEPWWGDAEKLWALLLEHRILASKGTIPNIQRVVSWFTYGDDDHTDEVEITNNVCPLCGYEEPAFYTINVPSTLFELEGEFFEFDDEDDDTIRLDEVHGFDSSLWATDESIAVMMFLEALLRSTQAGVRINALAMGSFEFDEEDDDVVREGVTGFDEGRWDGTLLELVQDLAAERGIPLEIAAYFHSCSAPMQHWEVEVEWGNVLPEHWEFDSSDDDVIRSDALRGLDGGIWNDDEEV